MKRFASTAAAAFVLVLGQPGPGIAPVSAQSAKAKVGSDQEIGQTFKITPDELPAPYATPAAGNGPRIEAYAGQSLNVPEGFTAALVARLDNPRRMLVLPDGDVVVAEQRPGTLVLLRMGPDDRLSIAGRPASGFTGPYGLAWRNGEILVADQEGIWSVPHTLQQSTSGERPAQVSGEPTTVGATREAGRGDKHLITGRGVFGAVRGHANRPLAIDPVSGRLYVGVGSMGNVDVEPAVKATIQQFEPDGSGQITLVSGVRNPCALAIQPGTGNVWAVVQERDGLGDRLVPDYLIAAKEGAFYGWPYAYIGRHPQPGLGEKAPEKVAAAQVPDLLFESHSSTLDLLFYTGNQFPDSYKGGAFVAMKGSWNRSEPTGYKVVFVPFVNNRPVGEYRNFITGFWTSGLKPAHVWGRPAALAQMPDGSLLVADDASGTVWRIAYPVKGSR